MHINTTAELAHKNPMLIKHEIVCNWLLSILIGTPPDKLQLRVYMGTSLIIVEVALAGSNMSGPEKDSVAHPGVSLSIAWAPCFGWWQLCQNSIQDMVSLPFGNQSATNGNNWSGKSLFSWPCTTELLFLEFSPWDWKSRPWPLSTTLHHAVSLPAPLYMPFCLFHLMSAF